MCVCVCLRICVCVMGLALNPVQSLRVPPLSCRSFPFRHWGPQEFPRVLRPHLPKKGFIRPQGFKLSDVTSARPFGALVEHYSNKSWAVLHTQHVVRTSIISDKLCSFEGLAAVSLCLVGGILRTDQKHILKASVHLTLTLSAHATFILNTHSSNQAMNFMSPPCKTELHEPTLQDKVFTVPPCHGLLQHGTDTIHETSSTQNSNAIGAMLRPQNDMIPNHSGIDTAIDWEGLALHHIPLPLQCPTPTA